MDRTININININEPELREYCDMSAVKDKEAFIMSKLVTIFDSQCRALEREDLLHRNERAIEEIKQGWLERGWTPENIRQFKMLLLRDGYTAVDATHVASYLKMDNKECEVLIDALRDGQLSTLVGMEKDELIRNAKPASTSGGVARGGVARGGGTNKTKRRRPKKKRSR
jgi:hypothetical protein